jgi:hypothetical protein
MILYHFTSVENVERIKRDGLRASAGIDDDMVGSDTSIVYLCDTPTLEATDAEMEMYRQHFPEQLVSKRWFRPQDSGPMARFKIRLPPHDRKLKQYGHWHRANYHLIDGLPNPDDVFARWAIDTWWLYFGDIGPSKIGECTIEEAILYRLAQPVRLSLSW